mgnify:CR=1 FL=1
MAAGARALVGGDGAGSLGYFYPPTILSGVDTNADILHTEIFGPVAPIVTFTYDTQGRLAEAAMHVGGAEGVRLLAEQLRHQYGHWREIALTVAAHDRTTTV